MDTPRKRSALAAGALVIGLYACPAPHEYQNPVQQAAGERPTAEAQDHGELTFLYPLDGGTLTPERKTECKRIGGIWAVGQTWSATPRLEYTGPGEIESAHAVLTAEEPGELMRIYGMVEQMKERIEQAGEQGDYAGTAARLPGLSREGNSIVFGNFNLSREGEMQELSFLFPIPLPPGRYQLDVVAETSDGRSHRATAAFSSDITCGP